MKSAGGGTGNSVPSARRQESEEPKGWLRGVGSNAGGFADARFVV